MTNTPPSSANLRGAVDLSSLVRPPAPPAGAPVAPAAVPSLVVDGTDANFTGILDLSQTVPVVVELYVGTPSPTLTRVVTEYAGRFVLATVDAAANPQLQQAFHATAAPTVAAVIGGRPIALYEGELSEADVRQVLEQLATLAAQNGVTGTVSPDAAGAVPAEPEELPLPPHHQEAYDAIAAGDYGTAIAEYKTAIAQDPRDRLAVAGLAQVSLLARLGTATAADIRSAAAAAPGELPAQLAVADLDVSGGHLEDAFARLLDLFPTLDAAGKDAVRTRLLDYFEIAGVDDPRVVAARRRLTTLLY
ncbi:co-chaperone YbbN [Lacisediminihabitans profunda]|uniref:Tetratricopeptide repeat protein n=1 Tax=Lacisediminihabitans profunda TaxID=2594790 RepID=A0A5C8UMX9_9MICO|nr:tetratricopeptide repeat protein [Lacisediminihabitans profunda]TXN29745.1 tetratricopeptide repeat protein [Lacisediminihabitans profunda]